MHAGEVDPCDIQHLWKLDDITSDGEVLIMILILVPILRTDPGTEPDTLIIPLPFLHRPPIALSLSLYPSVIPSSPSAAKIKITLLP